MTHYYKETKMEITTGRRTTPPRNHFAAARRWPLALVCGLLLLAGSASAQNASAGRAPRPGGSFKIDHPLDPANKHLSHSPVGRQQATRNRQ